MILIPTEEDIEEYRNWHQALESVWKDAVTHSATRSAIIGFEHEPPGRFNKVWFVWSREDELTLARAIKSFESLGPAEGHRCRQQGYADDHWLGVPALAQEELRNRESSAHRYARYGNFDKAEDEWLSILRETIELVGDDFPGTARIHFLLADLYFDLKQFDKHDEHFGSGLKILEASYQRFPSSFAQELGKRLNELIRVFLFRDQYQSAVSLRDKFETLRVTAPDHRKAGLTPEIMPFAKFHQRHGDVSLAMSEYKSLMKQIRRDSFSRIQDCADLFEASKFFRDCGEADLAEECFELLLVPFLDRTFDAEHRQFVWFREYRRFLSTGNVQKLRRLSEKLKLIEIDAGIRTTQSNSFGYVDSSGSWKIPMQYLSASAFEDGVARVKKGVRNFSSPRSILIDANGEELGPDLKDADGVEVPEGYRVLSGCEFSEGLLPLREDGYDESPKKRYEIPQLFGFMNESGTIVIPPRFSRAYSFFNGRAIVGVGGRIGGEGCVIDLEGAKYGVIDKRGEFLVSPEYESLGTYGDSLYSFWRGPNGGIVDASGRIVTELENCYEKIHFRNGFAVAEWGEDSKVGYLGPDGKVLVEPKFEFGYEFECSRALVRVDGMYGFIDTSINYIVEPIYEDANSFSGSSAFVKSGGLWGMINLAGQMVVEPSFDDVGWFHSGVAEVRRDELVGLVSDEGEIIHEPRYAGLKTPKDGLTGAAILIDSKLVWGFIDGSGQFVIEPRFCEVNQFSEGLAPVAVTLDDSRKFGYVDREGRLVIPADFDEADCFVDGVARVGLDSSERSRLYGLIDKTGTFILEPRYGSVGAFSEGLCAVGLRDVSH